MSFGIFASTSSPFDVAEEFDGRLRLLIPEGNIKVVTLYENYDSTLATVIYKIRTRVKSEVDPEDAFEKVSEQLRDIYEDFFFETSVESDGDLLKLQVLIGRKDEVKEAAFANPTSTNVELSIGGHIYTIVSEDAGYGVVKDGETKLSTNLPSVPYALGKIMQFALLDLFDLETLDAGVPSKEVLPDFFEPLALWLANTDILPISSREDLVSFVESLTAQPLITG